MSRLACVSFDRDIFQLQRYGGIRLYFTELSKALVSQHASRLCLLDASLVASIFPLTRSSNRGCFEKAIGFGLLLKSFACPLLPILPWQSPRVYHATYYRNFFIHLSRSCVVVTVHDLIHECYPQYFDPSYAATLQRYVMAKRRCIFAAEAIIAVSHATKNDLLRVYPQIEPNRVHVIHHGSDHVPAITPQITIESPPLGVPFRQFFLYVGSRGHYKGFIDLLLAFAELSVTSHSVGLVCVGSPFTSDEADRIQRLSIAEKVISVQADELHLISLYQHAVGFVYPSLCEGFGLPILEAMRSRCPVLCSDIPSSREIANRHALFFKAGDSKDLLTKLQHLFVLDPACRERHLSAAQVHASRFTWKDAAQRTSDLYLSLLERHSS